MSDNDSPSSSNNSRPGSSVQADTNSSSDTDSQIPVPPAVNRSISVQDAFAKFNFLYDSPDTVSDHKALAHCLSIKNSNQVNTFASNNAVPLKYLQNILDHFDVSKEWFRKLYSYQVDQSGEKIERLRVANGYTSIEEMTTAIGLENDEIKTWITHNNASGFGNHTPDWYNRHQKTSRSIAQYFEIDLLPFIGKNLTDFNSWYANCQTYNFWPQLKLKANAGKAFTFIKSDTAQYLDTRMDSAGAKLNSVASSFSDGQLLTIKIDLLETDSDINWCDLANSGKAYLTVIDYTPGVVKCISPRKPASIIEHKLTNSVITLPDPKLFEAKLIPSDMLIIQKPLGIHILYALVTKKEIGTELQKQLSIDMLEENNSCLSRKTINTLAHELDIAKKDILIMRYQYNVISSVHG